MKGGALYIAIIISIVIGILLSMFILLSSHNQRYLTAYGQFVQLQYNLNSGFEIVQSDFYFETPSGTWLNNSGSNDSIKIMRRAWGAYTLVSVITKNRRRRLKQSGLFGTFMSSDTGLVVADNGRPVGLSGNVVFKAKCYLPSGGIKPAYIEGQSYQGNPQNASFIKTAPGSIPQLRSGYANEIETTRIHIDLFNDTLAARIPLAHTQSFNAKTLVVEVGNNALRNLRLTNNIRLVGGDLTIDSSCHLSNVLIVCKKVHFGEGFKGSVNVIASDSIVCARNCRLNYPSSFVLLPEKESEQLRYIKLSEGCKFFGGIIAFTSKDNVPSNNLLISSHNSAEVNGLIYSSGYLHLEGRLNANIYGNKLLLKTPSAVYENHLLGCEIDPAAFASRIAIPSVFSQKPPLVCCSKPN